MLNYVQVYTRNHLCHLFDKRICCNVNKLIFIRVILFFHTFFSYLLRYILYNRYNFLKLFSPCFFGCFFIIFNQNIMYIRVCVSIYIVIIKSTNLFNNRGAYYNYCNHIKMQFLAHFNQLFIFRKYQKESIRFSKFNKIHKALIIAMV